MKMILTISDLQGLKFVKELIPLFRKKGCQLIEKDYETAIAEDNFSGYSLITLTMNHRNCPIYHKYAEHLRSLTDVPIVIFPYCAEFPPEDLSYITEDSDELMCLPVNTGIAVHNCMKLIDLSEKSSAAKRNHTEICEDGIILDIGRYIATVDGKEIILSKIECNILKFLMQYRNHFMTYSQIYRHVWGEEYSDNSPSILWNQISSIKKSWNGIIMSRILLSQNVVSVTVSIRKTDVQVSYHKY